MVNDSSSRGQSLAEVIIAVSVVVLVITGLIAGTTASLKTSQFNRSRSLAVKYAQSAMEETRKLRDTGWTAFESYGNSSGNTWCLDNESEWTDVVTDCDMNLYVEGIYNRTVTLTWDAINSRMIVDVLVSWRDTESHSVSLSSILTQWR